MARIGDFREAFLSPELLAAHGAHDGLANIRDAFTALKLGCWLNSSEKRCFSAPYETKVGTVCWNHFFQVKDVCPVVLMLRGLGHSHWTLHIP